ncbi:MAG: hypothetical protein K9G41_12735 [Flavobacteriales bacterium]|nr:hypothetical protein [Flavobacteriales bacterium]
MKRSYLNFVAVLGLSASIALLPSCAKKEGCTDPTASNYDADADKDNGNCIYDDATKTGELQADETWDANRIYYLQGRVVVPSGVTLTIDAGAIIKGKEGTETNASALIVAKGGRIIANGTAANPIIFTSELDNIEIGQKVGTNLTKTDNEKWGGVIILGNAPISAENGDVSANIEGIPANLGYGVYGGSSSADDSGVLNYVSIRHGGITIGEGNELNALTLGGVGTGTTITNVEVYATLDDGIECFGGTVNISDALVYFQGDDGLDVDMNYSGTIDGFAVVHGDGVGTDEGLEIDGPEGTTNTTGMFVIKNGICKYVDATGSGSAGDFKSKAQGTVQNVTFDYSALGGKNVKIRASYQNGCADPKTDAFTHLTAATPKLIFTDCAFSGVGVYTDSNDGATPPVTCSVPQVDLDAAISEMTSGSGSSYNYATKFAWGAAGSRGEL